MKAKASKPSESSGSSDETQKEEEKKEPRESAEKPEEPKAEDEQAEKAEDAERADVPMEVKQTKETGQADEAKETERPDESKGEEQEEVDPADMSIAGVCREKYYLSENTIELLKKLVRMKDCMHAIQTFMLVVQVCQVGASTPVIDDALAQSGPGSSFGQVQKEEEQEQKEEMANVVEVMSGVEIVMLICGMVYLCQQTAKMVNMCVIKCKKRKGELVYVHHGRSVYHKRTCVWFSPPPRTREPYKDDAQQQGFRSCWRCHPEDKPKQRAPELALSSASNVEEICGKLCIWCGDGICSRRKESHMNCSCTECMRDYAEAMWREWYDGNEKTYVPEASYDQTQPDDIDDATWERMTLAERRTALESQGRQFLGQSERQAYDEYVRQSQREADEVQEVQDNQTPEEGPRRRNRGRNVERDYESYVDPGTPDSTEQRTQGYPALF